MKKSYVGRENVIRRRFLTTLYEMANDLPDRVNSDASKIIFQMADALVTHVYCEQYKDDAYYQHLRILCNDLMNILEVE